MIFFRNKNIAIIQTVKTDDHISKLGITPIYQYKYIYIYDYFMIRLKSKKMEHNRVILTEHFQVFRNVQIMNHTSK